MELEEGKTYIQRNGEKVSPLRYAPRSICFHIADKSLMWNEEGICILAPNEPVGNAACIEFREAFDIVSEHVVEFKLPELVSLPAIKAVLAGEYGEIAGMFTWHSSPQGEAFWYKLYDEYTNLPDEEKVNFTLPFKARHYLKKIVRAMSPSTPEIVDPPHKEDVEDTVTPLYNFTPDQLRSIRKIEDTKPVGPFPRQWVVDPWRYARIKKMLANGKIDGNVLWANFAWVDTSQGYNYWEWHAHYKDADGSRQPRKDLPLRRPLFNILTFWATSFELEYPNKAQAARDDLAAKATKPVLNDAIPF